jgi:HEAT repeat protein
MKIGWLYVAMSLLLLVCPAIGRAQDKAASPDDKETEAKLDEQLSLAKEALRNKGSSPRMRVSAAAVLLGSDEPQAREIVLQALAQTENPDARTAVCKALSQATAGQRSIKNPEEFIEPLLNILTAGDTTAAHLAAEATLIFRYEQIADRLERIVTDSSLPATARLNAIYALKLHPDLKAVVQLLALIDDADEQVATAAQDALKSLGIPTDLDPEQLKSQGQEIFLRERLIRQETEIGKLQTDVRLWRKQYLSALNQIVDKIDDDTAKGKFLAEHLGSAEPAVKLWALETVRKWRVTPNTKIPAELEPILVSLISDKDRDVRLKTAEVLSLMGKSSSAEQLLEQLQVEQDAEVRMELFTALVGACYYGSRLNPAVEIPKEIRKKALDWAAKYLQEQDPKKAQKGADAIRRLLEQDGLTTDEVKNYLGLLAERYQSLESDADGALRGELLNAMAGLCAQRSICRAQATTVFQPLFVEALKDEADSARQAAIDGLVHIDKTNALQKLRNDFVDDSSAAVRSRLIDLAGEVGGKEDLHWLAEKINTAGESEPAWQAMLKIFKRSDAEVVNSWADKLAAQDTDIKLSDAQRISFLEIAEQKAAGEDKQAMLRDVRTKLGRLYEKTSRFEKAAECLEFLCAAAQTAEEKNAALADLLDVYLRWTEMEKTAKLLKNCLAERDLDSKTLIVRSIDDYLSNPPDEADTSLLLQTLAKIRPQNPQSRPKWTEQVERWTEQYGKVESKKQPEKAGSKS